jgi:hypothetical protein
MKLQEFSPALVQFHLWNGAALAMWVVACLNAKAVVPLDTSILVLLGVNSASTAGLRAVELRGEP